MKVEQNGKDIKGQLDSATGRFDYAGIVDGNEVKFGFDTQLQGMAFRIDFIGTVENGVITGKQKFGQYAEGTFLARRK